MAPEGEGTCSLDATSLLDRGFIGLPALRSLLHPFQILWIWMAGNVTIIKRIQFIKSPQDLHMKLGIG
jgi:hypothetical protein